MACLSAQQRLPARLTVCLPLLLLCWMRGSSAQYLGSWEEAAQLDKGWFPVDGDGDDDDIGMSHGRRLTEHLILGEGVLAESVTAIGAHAAVLPHHDHHHGDPTHMVRKQCRGTKGDWCLGFHLQPELPYKEAPRGSKECKANCNGVGNCNFDIGLCDCPAGWSGPDCTNRQLRPCTKERRSRRSTSWEAMSHIDEMGRDLDWLAPGWTASRCAGICDAELAMCWCDGKNKNYSYTHAPPGSPPGTPPIQRGRPLGEYCGKVKSNHDGKATSWGNVPYDMIYGPNGWCEAENGERCTCFIDGLIGHGCQEVTDMFCLNQCSGHGECYLGFCKCHTDWYGTDCSRQRKGAPPPELPDSLNGKKPYLKPLELGVPPLSSTAGVPPTADAGAAPPTPKLRKRPYIYVYDVPPEFTTRMLQYRLVKSACIWRAFYENNETRLNDWIYGVEAYFHDALLSSDHRTYDPEEADFFFVPAYITCYFWPINGWADYPFWYTPEGGVRPMHAANMLMEVLNWMKTNFPFWDKREGRDHIFIGTADEGTCWFPTEIYKNSIMLTHWGRMDETHTSNTGYGADDYTSKLDQGVYGMFQKTDWHDLIRGHPCYNPTKDLVIPSLKGPEHYQSSPLMGAEPYERDILLYFRGDVGLNGRAKVYSRGIRQKLYNMARENKWDQKHRIFIAQSMDKSYSEGLSRSKFCLVAPGDGWSARAEDSILNGCIPLVIMDNVHAVFESIIDWESFSVRIREDQIEQVPEILMSFTDTQIHNMQRHLTQVWHRFGYLTSKVLQESAKRVAAQNQHAHPIDQSKLPRGYPIQRVMEYPAEEDAFNTIMQWLYFRINATR